MDIRPGSSIGSAISGSPKNAGQIKPGWTEDTDTANPALNGWTRNVEGIGGDLAATQTSDGAVTLQLANLHGDIVGTMPNDQSANTLASSTANDEFGNPYPDTPTYPTYGWLGAKQRSRDTIGGTMLMGVRLYQPSTGRFLQTDPVVGGNANAYTYPNDPVNIYDLTGQWGCGWCKKAARVAWKYKWDIASTFVPGGQVYRAYRTARWAYSGYKALRSARVVHRAWRPARGGTTVLKWNYTGRNGGRKFLKLDRPHGGQDYWHWARGSRSAKGSERNVVHYRWWGKRIW